MCRLIDAAKSCGRWLRQPIVWLPLLAWAGLTLLVHWLMIVSPVERIAANLRGRSIAFSAAKNERPMFATSGPSGIRSLVRRKEHRLHRD